jgi:hypothetical protein
MAKSKSRKTQRPKSTGKKGKKFVEAKVFTNHYAFKAVRR